MTIKPWLAPAARFRLSGLRAAPPASTDAIHDRARIRRALAQRMSAHLLRDVGAGEA